MLAGGAMSPLWQGLVRTLRGRVRGAILVWPTEPRSKSATGATSAINQERLVIRTTPGSTSPRSR
ncbi:MAG: hypothetical protein JWN91_3683 [Nocardioides sp.]|nr:hypothetical protein [Nocardioides sp.]